MGQRSVDARLMVEALYLHLSTNDVGIYDIDAYAAGFAIGPLVGYKFIAGPGFTGFVQLGFSYVADHAEASAETGESRSRDEDDYLVNLNLNLGWSF